ncbi:MAG: alanine--tRNA ligase [Fimbriimonadaceae bacterium]|nr:alanine--tRNA ligase [Fimbriimonadaceae bacterium]QYK56345.1 MAG: alanine--tRNA ligase [Fimbriimonadaceae bacterium]
MTVRELRRKYLEFFEAKDHQRFPSGSLVPFDVTGRLDESLLFNGAGMVQFKPYFRGIAQPPHPRLVTVQKCLRTGDIDEVGDDSHLTFFEMLGNFSFGDYDKVDAIALSWEFLTRPEWLNLETRRLAFTVFEEDDESFEAWSSHVRSVGIEPGTRVFRLDEETNFWPAGAFSKGPPGPCGPNSEMFYWVPNDEAPPSTDAGYTCEDYLRDLDAEKWLEIWNDVFIRFEWQGEPMPEGGFRKTGMPSLPFASVDTGMGLERTAAVLGGHRSVYDTDAFTAILAAIDRLTRPGNADPRASRIIADHLRSASFCIADGVLPSNTGRGYVLRRLIRRAVLKGQRALRIEEPFMHRLVSVVVETFGDHYHELLEKKEVLEETLRNEEEQFRRTLHQGSELLARSLAELDGNLLPGEFAFRLYDTYGFPLEVTQEIAAEGGVEVDAPGYKRAFEEAQERSRGADQREAVYGGVIAGFVFVTEADDRPTPTLFHGYHTTLTESLIVGVLPVMDEQGRATGDLAIALDQTPFYAESGGQVSDEGILEGTNFALRVREVTKENGVYVHLATPVNLPFELRGMDADVAQAKADEELFRQHVQAKVDREVRYDTVRNHTATHLLHAALRTTLGKHVTQAGSLVAPDHLRFDFTHGKAMSPDEIAEVERIVNEYAMAAEGVVTYEGVPIDEARRMGAMALFGEKYGDSVRVVQIGDMGPFDPSFSRELCGGIHVRNTGQIGLFKVLHEASAASGVRRIVAVTGKGAYRWVAEQEEAVAKASQLLKTNPKELVAGVERLQEQLRDERRKRERLAQQGGSQAQVEVVGGIEFAVERLDDADPKDAQAIADRLVDGHPKRVAFVANRAEGKLLFVCKVGAEALGLGAKAGDLVREAAKVAGGGGGGRPDFATAGAKDATKLEAALQAAKDALAAAATP